MTSYIDKLAAQAEQTVCEYARRWSLEFLGWGKKEGAWPHAQEHIKGCSDCQAFLAEIKRHVGEVIAPELTVRELRRLIRQWEKRYMDFEDGEFLVVNLSSVRAANGSFHLSWPGTPGDPDFEVSDVKALLALLRLPREYWATVAAPG